MPNIQNYTTIRKLKTRADVWEAMYRRENMQLFISNLKINMIEILKDNLKKL